MVPLPKKVESYYQQGSVRAITFAPRTLAFYSFPWFNLHAGGLITCEQMMRVGCDGGRTVPRRFPPVQYPFNYLTREFFFPSLEVAVQSHQTKKLNRFTTSGKRVDRRAYDGGGLRQREDGTPEVGARLIPIQHFCSNVNFTLVSLYGSWPPVQ